MARSGSSRMKKPCYHCKRCLDHLDEKNQSMSCFLRRMTASPKHIMVILLKVDILLSITFISHYLYQNVNFDLVNGDLDLVL
jgi:hypothetical protein